MKISFHYSQSVAAHIIYFILTVNILFGQPSEIEFKHITAEDGLSLSSVTQVLQDSRGFLWIGTYNGLNRYDGYNFKVFLPDAKNPTKTIDNHSIWTLLEDSKGYLWIGTLGGLNRYDWRTEEFTFYKHNPQDPKSLSHDHVLTLYEDKTGNLWVGTIDGLNKFNPETNNFTIFKKVTEDYNPDSLNSVVTIDEGPDGELLLGTWNGLTLMQKDGKIVKQYFAESLDSKFFDYRKISVVYLDKQNILWVGTSSDGLKRYNPETNSFIEYKNIPGNNKSLSNNYVKSIYQDDQNNLWIGTRDGLNKLDPSDGSFVRILNDRTKPKSIINNEINSIYKDRAGCIWIGTMAGLSMFYESKNAFNYFTESSDPLIKGITTNRVSSVFVDKNQTVWLGSFNGLNRIDPNKKIITYYKNIPGNKNSLVNNNIVSVYGDHSGLIWIGTDFSGLNSFNPSTGEFRLYNYDVNDNESISNNGIISICEDRDNNLWFGTWWGLNLFNRKQGKFTRFLHDPYNVNTLRNDLVWTILNDSKGFLWFGTDGGGASKYDYKKNKFVHFHKDSSWASHKISDNRVFYIYETRDSIIWMCTNNGLNSYNQLNDEIKIYNNLNGLPGNVVNSMQEDESGNLWIATDKGISKFSRKEEKFYNYNKRNGLKELEFVMNSAAKAKDGTLYFGSRNGLMYFKPEDIKDDYLTAPLIFTDLKIFNQSVNIESVVDGILNESITSSDHISIPYHNSVITLEFALLDFYDVKRNNFRYKLEGFDNDWNEVGNRNSATYTNLPPGDYKFFVRAINPSLSDEVENSIIITIIPEFYQTWWFKIFIVIALISIAVIFNQLRTYSIKKQNRVLEHYVLERTRELDVTINELSDEVLERKKAEEKVLVSLDEKEILLKEIHHRVKNNLQIISSLLYLQSINLKDEETLNMLKDSQDRIRCMALVHEKLYQSEDLSEINFKEYVVSLIDYISRSFNKSDTEIITRINIENINLSLDTAISCGLIVNELITNTYKYAFPEDWLKTKENTFQCEFEISVIGELNRYTLIVKDNGIGVKDNLDINNISSLGLKLVYSLAMQLNGTVELKKHGGTQFIIEFEDTMKNNPNRRS